MASKRGGENEIVVGGREKYYLPRTRFGGGGVLVYIYMDGCISGAGKRRWVGEKKGKEIAVTSSSCVE